MPDSRDYMERSCVPLHYPRPSPAQLSRHCAGWVDRGHMNVKYERVQESNREFTNRIQELENLPTVVF
jgi:hypothetical protein